MTAREFMDEIAAPTVREFIADPCRRRGYLACLVALHVGDYLAPGRGPTSELLNLMETRLGAPFVALRRMANAAKHSEATSGSAAPMQSGSDTERPMTGWDISFWDEMRFDDAGGRYIEHGSRRFDMLDVCLIVMREYAELYPAELAGSALDDIRHSTASYAP